MARYIDADKVMDEINRIGGHNLCEWETIGVKVLIDRQPTADVAPKSEVEKIFEEIEELLECSFSSCHINGTEEQFDFYRADLGFQLAELKKKYTGERT